MKSALRITATKEGDEESESEDSEDDEDAKEEDNSGKPMYERVKLKVEAINDKYKFDILQKAYMDLLKSDQQSYKVRVYLISA